MSDLKQNFLSPLKISRFISPALAFLLRLFVHVYKVKTIHSQMYYCAACWSFTAPFQGDTDNAPKERGHFETTRYTSISPLLGPILNARFLDTIRTEVQGLSRISGLSCAGSYDTIGKTQENKSTGPAPRNRLFWNHFQEQGLFKRNC